MSHDPKKDIITLLKLRYKRSSKKEKTIILDEFCATFKKNRKYMIRVLNGYRSYKGKKRGRKNTYSDEAIQHLKRLWVSMEQMCSKNLVAAIPEWIKHYPNTDEETKAEILKMSPSTVDRRLAQYKAQVGRKNRTGTKPGSLIKNIVPIKSRDYNINKPGFMEADTVAHCGGSLSGEFIWSVTLTDIDTQWTENRAVMGKGAWGVLDAIMNIENSLPFEILSLNVDNGTEFLNQHLVRHMSCYDDNTKKLKLTRSRPYIKNDNAHVEQKNWTHVRQLFGYERYDNRMLLLLMNSVYKMEQTLLQNFFIPKMKLERKYRVGSKYKRVYSKPKTPYQRVVESDAVSDDTKKKLTELYKTLNPFTLKKERQKKLNQIIKILNKKDEKNNELKNDDKIAA